MQYDAPVTEAEGGLVTIETNLLKQPSTIPTQSFQHQYLQNEMRQQDITISFKLGVDGYFWNEEPQK